MAYNRPKGTEDWLGGRLTRLAYIEGVIRGVCAAFCAKEIRTPVMEQTELFTRGVGEGTDVVRKEMFTLQDAGGRSLTLKPEGTAGVARAFIENGLQNDALPAKLFYIAPMFRAERPQKGRLRQFHQFGVEMFGSYDARADAEIAGLAWLALTKLGVSGVTLRVNSLGCPDCRANHRAALSAYLKERAGGLCAECQTRIETNPLRALDCKNAGCQAQLADAPVTLDYLDDDCAAHFAAFKAALDAMGVPYAVDARIVRGLDYYTRTVFELVSGDLGAQSAVGGGGRYDGLIELLGGQRTGAVGFAIGLERLLIIMEEQGLFADTPTATDIYVGAMSEPARTAAAGLVHRLRASGVKAEYDGLGRSVKAQFKYADKIGARYAVMIGETELANGRARVKNMATGEETEYNLADIPLHQWQ